MVDVRGSFVPVLLPVAVVRQRQVLQEAQGSNARYEWPRQLLNRPVLLYVLVWLSFFGIILLLTVVLAALGVPPV